MTQKEAIERLAKWLEPAQEFTKPADFEYARLEYLRMLDRQAAALGLLSDVSAVSAACTAREQVHAIIEMLENGEEK